MEFGNSLAKPSDQLLVLFDLRVGDLLPFALDQCEAGMIMQWMPLLNVLEGVFRCTPAAENRAHGIFCALTAIGKSTGAPMAGVVPDDQMTQGEGVRLGFVVRRMAEGFLFFEYAVTLAVEGEFQGKGILVNARQALAVDVLVPRDKRLFGLTSWEKKALS